MRDIDMLIREAVELEPAAREAWWKSLSAEERVAIQEWAGERIATLRESFEVLSAWVREVTGALRVCKLLVECPDCQRTHSTKNINGVRCRCGTWLWKSRIDSWHAAQKMEEGGAVTEKPVCR